MAEAILLESKIGFEDMYETLPEEEDDKFEPINPKKYVPEWELEVKRYLAITPTLAINDINYEYTPQPTGLDAYGFSRWAKEEIKRCKEGYLGMCGKQYFYFNYGYIQAVGKKIRPQYRVIDNMWFKLVEACQKSHGWGIICVKRRRVGASWKEAVDMVHDCIFNTHFKIGMNSKTERDSFELFRKVKFVYENLPSFLKARICSSTKSFIEFGYYIKDAKGVKVKKGKQSTIQAVAPTDNAYEGMMLSKLIMDEAGKTKRLATIYSYAEDCLLQETRRVGIPIIFGTAGDIGAEGKDLEYMWSNADKMKLRKFFMAGYMGLHCDEFGNDRKEDCIRWIIYKRHEKEGLRQEDYLTFIQKYPLTIAEAFTATTASGVGDLVKIRAQLQSLRENPPVNVRGYFRPVTQDKVEWVPSAAGKIIIYEHPDPEIESLYIGGADPADHDDTFDDVSDLSLYIMKRARGTSPPRIVCEYTDRPNEVVEFFEQSLFCSIYYNRCKILVERNRYLMIQHFKQSGQSSLLARTPLSVARVVGGRSDTVGLQMTPATKEYLKGCIGRYVKDYSSWIPSKELLEEFLYFGAKNTDRAMAFGIALVFLEDYKVQTTTRQQVFEKMPHYGFKKGAGGRIERVTYKPKQGALDGYIPQKLDLIEPQKVRPFRPKSNLPQFKS